MLLAATKLRRKAGFLKWVALDGGWRDVLYEHRLARLDKRASRAISTLSPIEVSVSAEAEIAMICGHKQITMATYSLWSLLTCAEPTPRVHVHSDGTISDTDKMQLRALFPGIRISELDEHLPTVHRMLPQSAHPMLYRARAERALIRRQLDIHVATDAKFIIILDSDVITMLHPAELMEYNSREVRWMRDIIETLPASPLDFSSRTGVTVPCRFNSGVVATPKFGNDEFRFMERALDNWEPSWRTGYFLDQSLMACVAGYIGGRELPPERYFIRNTSGLLSATMVHYVGNRNVRPYFFTEGVNAILHRLT
jgi:hypothetical protein